MECCTNFCGIVRFVKVDEPLIHSLCAVSGKKTGLFVVVVVVVFK